MTPPWAERSPKSPTSTEWVTTTAGRLPAASLGRTLCHEHVVVRSPGFAEAYPWTYERAAILDEASRRLSQLKATGIDTIVDQTTVDLGRDPQLLRDAARISGITIIAATGIHLNVPRWVSSHSNDELADLFVGDLSEGYADTDIRAGIIKVASEETDLSPPFTTIFEAAATAHHRTGAPISTHTNATNRSGLAQARFLIDSGVAPERILIGHSGDSDDINYLIALLELGVYIGADRFGAEDHLLDETRMDLLTELIKRGHAQRIMLSHDTNVWSDKITTRERDRTRPHWNYQHLSQRVLPELQARGVSQQDVDTMLMTNPRLFLSTEAVE